MKGRLGKSGSIAPLLILVLNGSNDLSIWSVQ
jgi:hypothetical protein